MTVYVDTPLTVTGRMAALGGYGAQVALFRMTSDETRAELHHFAGIFRSSQARFVAEPEEMWHYTVQAPLRSLALQAGARPVTRAQMRELFDFRAVRPGEPEGEAGVTPGTATCLVCWWRSRAGATAGDRAAQHSTATGHPVMSREVAAQAAAQAVGALMPASPSRAPGRASVPGLTRRGRLPRTSSHGPAEGQSALFEDVSA